MATVGTITQLPKQFFLDAATLAGDGKQALSEPTDPTAGDQEEEANAADVTQNRQARLDGLATACRISQSVCLVAAAQTIR